MGKKKNLSLGRLTLRVMIPALVLLTGIILVMFRSIFDARSLVYKYIEDTAGLYVEKINTDIVQINYEVISLLKQNEKEGKGSMKAFQAFRAKRHVMERMLPRL